MVDIEDSDKIDKLHAEMLFARLHWPVPLTRWLAARNIATLLSEPDTFDLIKEVFLEKLSEASLESHAANLLFIIYAFDLSKKFDVGELVLRIAYPSILTEYLINRMFSHDGFQLETNWYSHHAVSCPSEFDGHDYFNRKLQSGTVLPLVFKTQLEKLQLKTKLPFMKQWEYEWHVEMETGKHVYSGTPHYFFGNSNRSSVGQFDTRQYDVLLSTYLRTLNHAKDVWGMPEHEAMHYGLLSIPLNHGLAIVEPVKEPDIPMELYTASFGNDNPCLLFDQVRFDGERSLQIFNLKLTPYEEGLQKTEVNYVMFLTKGAVGNLSEEDLRNAFSNSCAFWAERHPYRFDGILDSEKLDDHKIQFGETALIPTVLNTFKLYMGRWHHSYFGAGIRLPPEYLYGSALKVVPSVTGLKIKNDAKEDVGEWRVWHKDLSSVFPMGGDYSVGMATTSEDESCFNELLEDGFQKSYIARIRKWTKEKEYSEPDFTESFIFIPINNQSSSDKSSGFFSKLSTSIRSLKDFISAFPIRKPKVLPPS